MRALEFLRQGDVAAAVSALQQEVRADASNPRHRTFLFQLSAVSGDWTRAASQLAVAGRLDPLSLPMVQTYRAALECEALRQKVFSAHTTPLLMGSPEQWVALMLEALRIDQENRPAEAQQTRANALELAPAIGGTLNGEPFEWLADADSRLGPICEAIINGKYYWVPFARMKKIELDAPVDLRDVVWASANFTFVNGGTTVGLMPVRYPGSEKSSDNLVQLARKTLWDEVAEGAYFGTGQRMLATDQGEFPLLEVRTLEFNVPEGAEPAKAESADG